ncbi:MAG: phosphotransacetylase [Acidimicrobiales bacterium]
MGPERSDRSPRPGATPDGASAALSAIESRWLARLQQEPRRVVLTDGDDPRVVAAAVRLARDGGVDPVVLADEAGVARVAEDAGVDLPGSVEILAPEAAFEIPRIREAFEDAHHGRALPPDVVTERRRDALFLGAAAVRSGYAHACVGGSTRPSADVLRAALTILGPARDAHCVTSSFLMVLDDGRVLSFGDCAVLPEPDAEQLAEVALATSATFTALTGVEPKVALLSFSTKGSAEHRRVSTVREAVQIAGARSPHLCLDGELQADAALDIVVAKTKSPGSPVAGEANVLIFPNLDAGNIGYKLTERLGHARALGPLLQGLAAPMNDLSRGCSAGDVRAVALASALLAERPHTLDSGPGRVHNANGI